MNASLKIRTVKPAFKYSTRGISYFKKHPASKSCLLVLFGYFLLLKQKYPSDLNLDFVKVSIYELHVLQGACVIITALETDCIRITGPAPRQKYLVAKK